MKYKICLSVSTVDGEFKKMIDELSKVADVCVVGLQGFSLEGVDIFIGKKLSERALKTADRLKVCFAYKTGVEDFPMSMLAQKGITLVNSHVDAEYIAEYAFGLSISLVNRITECDKKLRHGIWYDSTNPYWKSIFDMKVGIMGYGHIGKKIHEILARNHIETYTIDRGKKYNNIVTVPSLEELCDKTNLIVVALPKTKETNDLFNKEIFARLKDKYIVNVGRSNCINQKDLYEALKKESIGGAAIDTWDNKPKNPTDYLNPSKYPFVELENIVLSPHQAMRVDVGHGRYVQDTLKKVLDYIDGKPLCDVVDLAKGY